LLIETGFLSNRDDEKILRDTKSRGKLASAIADQIAAVAIDLQKA
jgi:N-acetylmuramoyl-L-alanine amidase